MGSGLTRYTIPRKVEIPKEDRPDQNKYFTDELLKRKKADKYTGVHGRPNNPSEYTGRDVAKEKMLKEFKKEFGGKTYYGQKKV